MVCIGLFLLTSKYLGRARDRSNSSSSRRGHGQAAEFSDQIVSDRSAETDQDNVRASGDQNVEVMSSSQRREAYGTPTESVPRGEESTPTLTGDDQPAAVIDGDTRDAQTDQGDGVESAHSETQVEDDQESIQSSPPDEDPEHRLVPRIARFWRRGGFFNLLVFLSVFEIVSVLLRTGKLHDLVLGLSLSVATYKFVETKLSLAVWEAVCPSIETVFACALEKLESSRQWSYSVLGDANERIAQHTEILRDHVHRNQAYASTAARRGQSALASYRQQLSVGLAELDITTIAAALLVIYVVYRALYRFAAWELLKLVGLVAVAYLAYQLIESGSAGDGRVDRSGSNASFNTGYRGVFRRTGGISRHRRRW
ncbi:hypothetical protein NDN08_002800 [Rhodosorus marinus]|uniref:Reticulon-like protein n=1 Tax=Rhodosorus marinus TaxID=101924 RepID=A0AAV8UZ13_9RHOD|nr:hypothetical protein NDN08_002800 [Rhodosorus marinus]